MYELCPKKYYHIKVAKDAKDADSAWSGDGKFIHDSLKKRVCDDVPLPIELRYLEPMAGRFADAPGLKSGELQLALDADFVPCDWFDRRTYVRAIIDLLIVNGTTATIIDWKTGKVKENFDQIKLSAAVLSKQLPEIKTFKLAYVWTKHRHVSPMTLEASDMPAVWANYLERVKEIEEALLTTTFPAEPNPLCKWCPVLQCPHNENERGSS